MPGLINQLKNTIQYSMPQSHDYSVLGLGGRVCQNMRSPVGTRRAVSATKALQIK